MDLHISYRGRGESMDRAHGDTARLAYQGVHRVSGEHSVPPAYGFDVSQYPTYGEVAYEDALSEFPETDVRAAISRVECNMFLWIRHLITDKVWWFANSVQLLSMGSV